MSNFIASKRAFVALLASAAVSAPLAVAPPAQANAWPQDGASIYNLRFNKQGPFYSRADELKQAWRRTVDGDVTGTPIVLDNKFLYVGTHGATVYKIARDNGFVAHATHVGGAVHGSLLFYNNTIYASVSRVGSPRLVALDPDTLAVKWSTIVDTQADADACAAPNYSAADNLVYIAIGACKAERDRKPGVRTRGAVIALDATSGAVVWKSYTVPSGSNGGGVTGTPLVIPGYNRLYVGTDHAYSGTAHGNTDALLAFNLTTGAIEGRFQAQADDVAENNSTDPQKRVGFTSAPNVLGKLNGTYPVAAGAGTGKVYAVDPTTMASIWTYDVSVPSSDGGIVGSAAWDGKVYQGTAANPGLTWGLNLGGTLRYLWPGVDNARTGPSSISQGVVYSVDSLGNLTTADSFSGRPLGRFAVGAPSTGGVSFARSMAFVGVGTGTGTGGAVVAFK
jgi:polyvinyl alcohol dehydrogenase (cytochrome)